MVYSYAPEELIRRSTDVMKVRRASLLCRTWWPLLAQCKCHYTNSVLPVRQFCCQSSSDCWVDSALPERAVQKTTFHTHTLFTQGHDSPSIRWQTSSYRQHRHSDWRMRDSPPASPRWTHCCWYSMNCRPQYPGLTMGVSPPGPIHLLKIHVDTSHFSFLFDHLPLPLSNWLSLAYKFNCLLSYPGTARTSLRTLTSLQTKLLSYLGR